MVTQVVPHDVLSKAINLLWRLGMATPAIKTPGGIMVRVIEALNGFRTKHGYWPNTLEMDSESIACLATDLLTPFGFFLLQSRVEIVRSHELIEMPRAISTSDTREWPDCIYNMETV